MSTRIIGRKGARQYKSASKPRLIALEPRMLFDGAAVATVVDAGQDSQTVLTDKSTTSETNTSTPNSILQAADTPIAIDANQIEAVASLSGMIDGALALAQPVGSRHELIVVDGSLENLQSLLDNISRIAPDKTLLVLDPATSEADQLTTYLQQHSAEFDAIHVVSHGGPGWISLNEQVLSLDTLDQNAVLWNSVKTGLTETGDLLLYGCSVAADANGQTQLNALANFTGADIAASIDVTGSDGNWVLESTAGEVDTSTLAPLDWQGNLYTWVAATSSPSGMNNRLHATYGVFEGAWWGDPQNAPTYFASYDDNGVKADLVLGNNFGGSGAGFSIVATGSASSQRLTDVQATTYDQAVANNEYFAATAFVQSSYDIALRALKYNQVSNNASTARMAVALYDVAAGTLTRIGIGFGDIIVPGGTNGVFATFRQSATATDLVPMISGRSYEIRFYGWGASTVYIDNPQLFAMYDSTVSVDNVTVNEASPTAVFSVTAMYGQNLSLALGAGSAAGGGTDYGSSTASNLQYSLNGGLTWINYTAAFNNTLTGDGNTTGLLVRTPINNDATFEGAETFTLTVTPTGGIAAVGTGTIVDDGTGTIFTSTGAVDSAAVKNDDRPSAPAPVLVNNVVVNEASPTAVFTVSAPVGQELTLALANGIAIGSGTDYGSGAATNLEYSLDGGATWVPYTGTFNNALTGNGTTTGLLVRTPITNDTTPDNGETFTLTATPTGGTAVTGTATIKDDGTGTIFTATGAVDNITAKNNDITVNSITVNEASPTTVFTVIATVGQNLSLALANGTATGSGTDYGSGMAYSLDGGTTWITYTGAFDNALTGSGTTTGLLVRTPITNDTTPDNGETFTLTATPTGGTAVTGTATIKDDGTGTIFTATGTVDNVTAKNNDITVNSIAVNEASPTAVFTVTATVGQELTLALANGTATGSGTDYGSGVATNLQYSLDGGATWVTYTGAFNNNLTGSGTTTGLLVRTPIINDAAPDNGETFTLTATPTGGTAVTGTATIKDDGSGTIFTATGAVDNITAKNNDITVNNLVVNEGSPYAVFTVTATQSQNLTLALTNGTALGAGTDYGSATATNLQFSLDGGSTWTSYTGAFNATLTGAGLTSGLLVRTPIINDASYEMAETFTLTATPTGGVGVVGTATIKDDGTGTIFTASGAVDNATIKDDDRPVNPAFVNNLLVNEGSNFAVFTVTGVPSAQITLALSDGTALNASDYTNSLEYWNGIAWVVYSSSSLPTLNNTDGALKVRVPILQDTILDGGENFQLTVRYTGIKDPAITSLIPDTTNVFIGNAIIVDDGSGLMWDSTGTPITPATTAVVDLVAHSNLILPDDDRPLTINNLTVNEGSPYAVFTVGGIEGQYVKLALGATSTGTDATLSGSTADIGQALEYFNGIAWVAYIHGSFVQIPTDGNATPGQAANLLVRVAVINDAPADNGETFTLTATNTGTLAVVGTGTILDNGTGDIFSGNSGTPDANVPTSSLDWDRNDPPVGTDKTIAVLEDGSYTFAATDFGFTDPLDTPANTMQSVIITTLPTDGTLKLNGVAVTAGQIITVADVTNLVYAPVVNANGASYANFTFQVVDNGGTANNGQNTDQSPNTITINVTPVADLTAANDSNSTNEDTSVNGSVTANDATTSGGVLTYAKATDPAHGVVVFNPDGTYTYTPSTNFNGADTFTYTVTDATSGESLTKTVTITVTPVNDPPVDGNETAAVTEDMPLTVTAAAGLLANAVDVDGDTTTISSYTIAGVTGTQSIGSSVTIAGVGSLTINADGSYSFTPVIGYSGAIPVITYTVSDGHGGTDTSTLSLSIVPVDHLFSDANEVISTLEDTPTSGNVIDSGLTSSDGPITLTSFQVADDNTIYTAGQTATIAGVGTITIASDGTYTFTPVANFNGAVPTVTYSLSDGYGTSETSTLGITVTSVNDPFVDANESVTTLEDATKTGNVIDSGLTSSDGPITLTSFQVAGDNTTYTAEQTAIINGVGSITIASDGTYTFTPAANYNGTVPAITYSLSDDAGATVGDSSTLIITVTSVVDLTAANDTNSTPEDTAVNGTVATNDSTTSGGSLTYAKATDPSHGAVVVNADGTYTYTPAANFNGTDTFTYTVTDAASGEVLTKTVTINVTPVADLTAANDTNSTPEDTPVNGTVATNDSTTSGGSLTYAKATDPSHGAIVVNADGTYTYTPAANFNGTDTFTYTVTDAASGEVLTKTVTITVAPVNDPPVDGNESVNVTKNTTLTVPANSGLLANASDIDGGVLSITEYTIAGITGTQTVASPVIIAGVGSLTINADGSYSFIPLTDYTGSVPLITYTVIDGQGGSVTSTLALRVPIGRVPPVLTAPPVAPVVTTPPVEISLATKAPEIPATVLTPARNISPNIFIAKNPELPTIQMGRYEYNAVVLDFNGTQGGINQFGLPHTDSTSARGAVGYSNSTPYAYHDRVSDEIENAQRTIKMDLVLSKGNDSGLRNPLLPPEPKLDADGRASYTLPAGTFVGGKGDIKLAAFTKDGKPLPDWIKFNPVKGNFDIAMPKGTTEPIEIQVIATDAKGDQAKTKLNIKPPIKKLDKAAFIGKSSLVSQIKSAVMIGRG